MYLTIYIFINFLIYSINSDVYIFQIAISNLFPSVYCGSSAEGSYRIVRIQWLRGCVSLWPDSTMAFSMSTVVKCGSSKRVQYRERILNVWR